MAVPQQMDLPQRKWSAILNEMPVWSYSHSKYLITYEQSEREEKRNSRSCPLEVNA